MAISPLPNMVGPQVSGPLGGASFLSVDEMTSGIDRSNKIANQQLDTFAKGYNLGEGIQASQAAKQKKAELATIKAAEFEAQNQFMQQQQAPQQTVAPSTTTPETPVTAPGVVQAPTPVLPQAAAPAAPASVSPPSAPVAAASTAPAQPEATPPVVQPTAQTPAPVAASGAPVLPQEAQPTEVAPKSALERMRTSITLPNGALNRFAQPVVDSRKKLIAGLVEQGKVSPETAQEYNEAIDAARAKAEKETVELDGKIAEIDGKKIDNRKKAIEVKVAFREAEDNAAFHVYQTLMAGDEPNIDGAKLAAGELGVDFDGSPKAMKDLQIRAQRSPDYKANLENAKAEKELAKGGKIETAGLPDGYFRVEGNPTVFVQGDDGKPRMATQSEIEAAGIKRAKAGATQVSVGGGGETPGSLTELQKAVGKADSEVLGAGRSKINAAKDSIKMYDEILTLDPAKIPGGASGYASQIKNRIFGVGDKAETEQQFIRNRLSNIAAALALNSRGLLKGQGAITDREQAMLERAKSGDMNFSGPEWHEFAKAMKKVELANMKSAAEEIDRVGKRYPGTSLGSFNVDESERALIKEQEASQADPMAKYKRK